MNNIISHSQIYDKLIDAEIDDKTIISFDRQLDSFFGIPDNRELDSSNYQELSNEALSTSYRDYLKIFEDMSDGSTLLDFGAGFCRGTLLSRYLKLNMTCLSVEIDQCRIDPAKNFLKDNTDDLINADFTASSFSFPNEVDAILVYLPAGRIFYALLKHLVSLRKEITIYAIESHGQLISHFDLFPSIFCMKSSIGKTSISRHDDTIYSYKFNPNGVLTLKEQFFLELALGSLDDLWELQVKDARGLWVTPLYNCEFFIDDNQIFLETVNPRRMLNVAETKLSIRPKSQYCKWFEKQSIPVVKLYIKPLVVELISGEFKATPEI